MRPRPETHVLSRSGLTFRDPNGARGKLERSFLVHLAVFRDVLDGFDPEDPDAFPAVIAACPEMRIAQGRVADLCRRPKPEIRAWSRARDLPDGETQKRIVATLRHEVDIHLMRAGETFMREGAAEQPMQGPPPGEE